MFDESAAGVPLMVHVLLSIFKPVGSVGLTMQLVAEVIGEEYAAFEPPFELPE